MKLPVPSWFDDVLRDLVSVAERLGTPWMLLGAIPVGYYGWVRVTSDLDFGLAVDTSASEDVNREMAALGYRKVFGPEQLSGKEGVWMSKYAKGQTTASVVADVFFAVGDWQKAAVDRRVAANLRDTPVFIPSLEDLILYKLLSYREKDVIDLEGIWQTSSAKIDWTYLWPWVERFAVEAEFREIAEMYGGGGTDV